MRSRAAGLIPGDYPRARSYISYITAAADAARRSLLVNIVIQRHVSGPVYLRVATYSLPFTCVLRYRRVIASRCIPVHRDPAILAITRARLWITRFPQMSLAPTLRLISVSVNSSSSRLIKRRLWLKQSILLSRKSLGSSYAWLIKYSISDAYIFITRYEIFLIIYRDYINY